jgi:N,N'-diacetylchitobiose transport system permease protein
VSVTVAPGQQVGGLVAETGTREVRRTGGGRRRVTTWVLSAVSVLLFLFFVFPVYWMVNTSLQPNNEIRGADVNFWPENFTLRNYATVLFDPGRTPFLPPRATRSSSRSSR